MLKSSGGLAVATFTSRLLGMVREIVYANFMGTTWVAGAFAFAFQIPNLFRRLLGEGALTVSFIPIFKEKEISAGEKEMWHAANAVISGLIFACLAIIVLAVLGVSLALAWGTYSETTRLMLELLRIMFPYLLLVCLAAVFIGMLNARGRFFIPALGAIMLNLVMIATVLFLAPRFGKTLPTQIFALAFGVLLAGIAQMLFQLPALREEGFRFRWVSPWKNETVRRVVRQMLPGTIGVAAFQINVLVTNAVALRLDGSIVASFRCAVSLMELPQGVFGLSLATYLLPTLAGLAVDKKMSEFRSTLAQGLGYMVFINALAAVLLFTLGEPIIRLLFEHGEFTALSTRDTTLALVCLAPGLVAFSMVNILARAFYALGDTGTPMRISIACFAINLLVVFVLIGPYRQGGMGLANTVSAIFNVGFLLVSLRKKIGRLELSGLRKGLVGIFASALVAGMISFETNRWLENNLGHARLTLKLAAVFVPMLMATLAYFALASWFKIRFAGDLIGVLKEQFKKLWKAT